METKDKELLLKDLCARLPYGVKVEYNKCMCEVRLIDRIYEELTIWKCPGYYHDVKLEDCKPYLFPMSNITEEQRNDISKLLIDTQNECSPYGELNVKGCDNLFICVAKQANIFINYCLTYHLDINGLIEKGLALDATGLNIY